MTTLGITTLKVAISASLGTFPGILQSLDYSRTSDVIEVKNQYGEVCSVGYSNVKETLNAELYCTGSITTAIGTLITVTDTDFTTWAGTTWALEEVGAKAAVGDGYIKSNVKMVKRALITS
jgi:hypothetical protein